MASKVLLVQSDAKSRKLIADFLTEIGFAVEEAKAGAEVMRKLHAERKRFHLLIYDFDLAHSDRVEMAVAVRASRQVIPVIVMNSAPSITADRVLFDGPVEFVKKPLDLEQLSSSAIRLLARRCRRKHASQTWHTCTTCTDWPTADYEERVVTPLRDLELCNECRLSLQQGLCA